ncbi:MAG: hypothetical protein K2Q26_11420 [Bdellovibrionales bacterium]|nr:hypothetical protein [Bdellovibrionales bacterium]
MVKGIDEYIHLYPHDRLDEIRRFFAKIDMVKSTAAVQQAANPNFTKTIAALKAIPNRTLFKMIGSGYSHVIQEDRHDFAFALITTAFIIANPNSFYISPLPYLFKSYNDGLTDSKIEKVAIQWKNRGDKDAISNHAINFFSQHHKASLYMEQILFIIDEMISNSAQMHNPDNEKRHIIFAYSDDRLLIANRDSNKCIMQPIRDRLKLVSMMENLQVRQGDGGAGLGIPMMVNASTNFYFITDKSGGTLTCALIDMRRGLRDLEEMSKNLHFFEVQT